jgi:hypothetical protein
MLLWTTQPCSLLRGNHRFALLLTPVYCEDRLLSIGLLCSRLQRGTIPDAV